MKTIAQLIYDIRIKSAAMKKLTEDMPRIIGVESVRILKENFTKGGYDDGKGFKKWNKRSPATNTAYEYNRTASYRTPKLHKKSRYKNPYKGSVVSSKRPTLVQTGNLRDSLSFRVSGSKVNIGVYPRMVTIGGKTRDAMAYAERNNEGGTGHWGKHSVRIPKRQFMPRPTEGPNRKILMAVEKKFDSEVLKFMKDWKK
jgi:hypothetical protein